MAMPTVKVKIGADTEGLDKGLAKASGNMRGLARTSSTKTPNLRGRLA